MKGGIIAKIFVIVLAVVSILTAAYVLFITSFLSIHGEGETSVEMQSEEIQIE